MSKKIPIEKQTYGELLAKAKERGLTVDEYVSQLAIWGMAKGPRKVRVSIEVPKGVLDFLRDFSSIGGLVGTPTGFIEEEVAKIPEMILGSLSNMYFDADYIRKKYGLERKPDA